MAEKLTIGTLDLSTVAHIESWEGILDAGEASGDLIPFDFTAGAVWVPGQPGPYSFVVPLAMKGTTPATAVPQLQAVQALIGTEYTFTREYLSTTETCQGVVTSVTPVWDFRESRALLRAVVTCQNLDGTWS